MLKKKKESTNSMMLQYHVKSGVILQQSTKWRGYCSIDWSTNFRHLLFFALEIVLCFMVVIRLCFNVMFFFVEAFRKMKRIELSFYFGTKIGSPLAVLDAIQSITGIGPLYNHVLRRNYVKYINQNILSIITFSSVAFFFLGGNNLESNEEYESLHLHRYNLIGFGAPGSYHNFYGLDK